MFWTLALFSVGFVRPQGVCSIPPQGTYGSGRGLEGRKARTAPGQRPT